MSSMRSVFSFKVCISASSCCVIKIVLKVDIAMAAMEMPNARKRLGHPGACIIKRITAVINRFCNKLKCLSLASLSSLV
jgi:hypothetical protein